MKLLFGVFVALLLATPAQAFHKNDHTPPGLALPLCDCLVVEVRASIFAHQSTLIADPVLRMAIGDLYGSGALFCTELEPDPRGEPMLRNLLVFFDGLDGVPGESDDICPR